MGESIVGTIQNKGLKLLSILGKLTSPAETEKSLDDILQEDDDCTEVPPVSNGDEKNCGYEVIEISAKDDTINIDNPDQRVNLVTPEPKNDHDPTTKVNNHKEYNTMHNPAVMVVPNNDKVVPITIEEDTDKSNHSDTVTVADSDIPMVIALPNDTEEEIICLSMCADKNKGEKAEGSTDFDEGSIPDHVSCTACNKTLTTKKRKICKHPRLGVLLCKSCLKFINSNDFTKDAMGLEEYCTWCGDGGNLVCCDFCEKAYCKHCVKRNLGKEFLKTLLNAEDDVKWKCFFCDSSQIITFIEECKAVIQHFESRMLKETTETTVNNKTNPVGPSQSERRKRLSEVAKQVENVTLEPVRLKSSFPRYEISDDDDDEDISLAKISENKNSNSDNIDSKKNIVRLASSMPCAGNSVKSVNTNHQLKENTMDQDNVKLKAIQISKIPGNDKKGAELKNKNSQDISTNSMGMKENSQNTSNNTTDKIPELKNNTNVVPLKAVFEKLQESHVSEIITNIRKISDNDNEDVNINTGNRRAKKDINYNENNLRKDAEKEALKSSEEKEKEPKIKKKKSYNTEEAHKSERSKHDSLKEADKSSEISGKKRKQTIVMVSTSEDSDEEIIVMSKSGKKRVISKSILLLAQAALSQGDSKKLKKDDDKRSKQEKNKMKNFMRLNFSNKKQNAMSESSSSNEKSSDDSESESEKRGKRRVISKKRYKKQSLPSQSSSLNEDKAQTNAVDDQQPGPSGIRPKNKLQRRKLERQRRSSSSESSEDYNYSWKNGQKCGILSKKFRHNKEENILSNKTLRSNDVDEVKRSSRVSEHAICNKDEKELGKEVNLNKTNNIETEKMLNLEGVDAVKQEENVSICPKDDGNNNNNKSISDIDLQTEVEIKGKGEVSNDESNKDIDNKNEGKNVCVELNKKQNDLSPESEVIRYMIDHILDTESKTKNQKDAAPDKEIQDNEIEDNEIQDNEIQDNEIPDNYIPEEILNQKISNKEIIDKEISDLEVMSVENASKCDTVTVDINSDSDSEVDIPLSKLKNNRNGEKLNESVHNDSATDETPSKDVRNVITDTKNSSKSNKSLKSNQVSTAKGESNSDSENSCRKTPEKNKKVSSKEVKDSDSVSESSVEPKKKLSKRIQNVSSKEEKSSDSEAESSIVTKSRSSNRIKNIETKKRKKKSKIKKSGRIQERDSEEERDDDSEGNIEIKKTSKRKRSKRLSEEKKNVDSKSEEKKDVDSKSDSDVPNKKKGKAKLKKQRKRVRYNSNADEAENSNAAQSSSSSDNDEVNINDFESDTSSSDGSIIITRRSNRLNEDDKKKRKKGSKKKQKGKKKETVELSDSDGEEQTPSKGSRKKIRRILKDDELDKETIEAREVEEQRRKRLQERTEAERQEVNLTVDVAEGDFVLEKNEKKEALVALTAEVNKHLKPHQRKGIQFIYDCLIETISSYKKGDGGGGCLLAHCMGLGKTLQIVGFVHTVMNNENIKMEKILVCAPLNTVLNWEQEFEKWLPEEERIDIYVLSYCNGNKERVRMLRDWFKNGGVIISGYEMYRNLINATFIKSKKMKEDLKKFLCEPGPDMVVCDEGHVLRNSESAISKAMNNISTKRRVVLTGTPLQNNLPEYHVMVDFVKPKLLGTRKEFLNRFVNPIKNGQCSNSTSFDVRIMKQRCHILYQLLSGCVQRQDYAVLTPFLPQKREYTIFVRLSEKQQKMYEHYLEEFVYQNPNQKLKGSSLFSDFQCLARIWSHPWALHVDRIRAVKRNRYKDSDSMDEFLDDENDDDDKSESSESEKDQPKPWTVDTSSDEEDESKRRRRRHKAVSDSSDNSSSENDNRANQATSTRSTRSRQNKTNAVKTKDNSSKDKNSDDNVDETEQITMVQPNIEPGRGSLRSGINFKDSALNPEQTKEKEEFETDWFDKFLTQEDEFDLELGGKLVLLLEILANAEAVGDKVLVFSQSLTTLDLIESSLGGGKIRGNELNWCHGVDYFRMDGSTQVKQRKRWADIFNDPENEQCRLFLISTKAGSLGINMVAANRVVVFDCSWNPSHDVQSVFRVYRFGQTKPVYVYRLIAQGTMEEKIYGRQITKLATAGRVVDERQIERHFTEEEIRELYTFSPDKIREDCETPQLPKDPLLAEVLQRLHPKHIVRYHEHDLLLENVESEELTEEERKIAWKNYEDEKDNATRRLDFRNFMPTANPEILPRMQYGLLQQQNQQILVNRFAQLPGFQNARYAITYPPEMTMEQRQQALVELRRRELMRLIQQQQQQQLDVVNRSRNVIVNDNISNGYRYIRVPHMLPQTSNTPSGTGNRLLSSHSSNVSSGTGNRLVSSHSSNVSSGTGNRLVSSHSSNVSNTFNASSITRPPPPLQTINETHQGGYLASQKKGRPSRYDT